MKKLLCAAAAAVMVISSTVVPAAGQEKYSAQTRPDFTRRRNVVQKRFGRQYLPDSL